MSQRIFVGNLPSSATDDEIRELFSEHGDVEGVHLVTELSTGQSRGYGYVKMANGIDAAVRALGRRRLGEKRLDVRRALPLTATEVSRLRTPKRARNHRLSEASTWSFSEPKRIAPVRLRALSS